MIKLLIHNSNLKNSLWIRKQHSFHSERNELELFTSICWCHFLHSQLAILLYMFLEIFSRYCWAFWWWLCNRWVYRQERNLNLLFPMHIVEPENTKFNLKNKSFTYQVRQKSAARRNSESAGKWTWTALWRNLTTQFGTKSTIYTVLNSEKEPTSNSVGWSIHVSQVSIFDDRIAQLIDVVDKSKSNKFNKFQIKTWLPSQSACVNQLSIVF